MRKVREERWYRWCELSEEQKRKAVKRYSEEELYELTVCSDALFDAEGYCMAW